MRELNINEALKKGLVVSIALGVLLSLLFGMAKAALYIEANRYIELGMYNIAFYYLRSIINESFLIPFVIVVAMGLLISLIHILLLHFLKDGNRIRRLTSLFTVLLAIGVSWLLGAYFLNKSSWYPSLISFKGILYNSSFTLGCLIVGFLIYKIISARYNVLIKFFNFKLLLVVCFFLLVLNGYFYYNKFFNVQKGTNIILITVDTLRADHLGYDGYSRDTSPNIDAFAEEGVVFSRAFAQWPQTTPSIASMFTSTYGHTNGVVGDTGSQLSIDDYFVLLPEVLKDNNYNTVSVVTNLYLGSDFKFDQGIETHFEAWRKVEVDGQVEHLGTIAEDVTKKAVNWLGSNHKKGKFFMWVHYLDPHAPYTPPEPFKSMFVDDKFYDGTKRVNLVAPDPSYPEIGGLRERARLGHNDILDYYIAQYDGETRYVDEKVGILLKEIKKLGIYENSLIIFTSDHGESLGEHNYFFWHGRLPYDDCLRVPLIIKFPTDAKIPSKIISQSIGLIDFLPTVLDFINLPVPKEAEGTTLMPMINGEKDYKHGRYIFQEAGFEENYQRIIRKERWKLIFIANEKTQKIMKGVPFELYDTHSDPHELNNSINAEKQIAQELKKEVFLWTESANRIEGVSSPKSVDVDKETRERLKSLGYIQ